MYCMAQFQALLRKIFPRTDGSLYDLVVFAFAFILPWLLQPLGDAIRQLIAESRTIEGLLMLTNDGELKRAMELPSSGIPRTYRARAFGDVTQAQLDELIEGVEIDGIRYGRIEADLERGSGKNRWVEMTLTEGKNREVRRVLEHLGLQVNRLLRTAYGPFELADLPRGQAVEIRQADVERFRKQLRRGGQL